MPTWQEKVAESLLKHVRRNDVNPFSALEVQISLSRVDAHIAALLDDESRFARGHHLIAARMAYDKLLDQACRLAGVTDLPEDKDVRRVIAEAELRNRGWSW
jgi:hypothetical protein